MKKDFLKGMAIALTLSAASLAQADEAAMAAQGEVLFKQNCGSCHAEESSRNAFGPSLSGVVGREAGTVPRYAYSDALEKSGIVWTEDNLRQWLKSNDDFVPGTRMRHVGIEDQATQDFIIAYLKTL